MKIAACNYENVAGADIVKSPTCWRPQIKQKFRYFFIVKVIAGLVLIFFSGKTSSFVLLFPSQSFFKEKIAYKLEFTM